MTQEQEEICRKANRTWLNLMQDMPNGNIAIIMGGLSVLVDSCMEAFCDTKINSAKLLAEEVKKVNNARN